jgi:hypothetical protein
MVDDRWSPRPEPARRDREEDRGRRAGAVAGGLASTWQLSLAIWPVENRPALMQDERVVNEMNIDTLLSYKKIYDQQAEKEGKGHEEFGRDRRLPTRVFKQQEDNCMDLLHELR